MLRDLDRTDRVLLLVVPLSSASCCCFGKDDELTEVLAC